MSSEFPLLERVNTELILDASESRQYVEPQGFSPLLAAKLTRPC